MSDVTPPAARTALSDDGTTAARPFVIFFRDLATSVNALSSAVDDVRAQIPDASPFSPNANVVGGFSIATQGTLKTGIVRVLLEGDVQEAEALSFYGSLDASDKGWHAFSDNFRNASDTLDLTETGVTAGTYGSPAPMLVAFQVDANGRLLEASSFELIAGNGISFDTDPDTGAITISVNSFIPTLRITQDGSTRTTRAGNFRATR